MDESEIYYFFTNFIVLFNTKKYIERTLALFRFREIIEITVL